MKDIKLVALDMDGTLLNSNEEISDKTKAVIKSALDKHIHVVLSTGRSLTTSFPYGQELNLTSYIITCNGGEIWTMEKELVEQNMIEAKLIGRVWDLC